MLMYFAQKNFTFSLHQIYIEFTEKRYTIIVRQTFAND